MKLLLIAVCVLSVSVLAGCHETPVVQSAATASTGNGIAGALGDNAIIQNEITAILAYADATGKALLSQVQFALTDQAKKLSDSSASNARAAKELQDSQDATKKAQADSSSRALHMLELIGGFGILVLAAGGALVYEFPEDTWTRALAIFGALLVVLGFSVALIYRASLLAMPWLVGVLVAGFAAVVIAAVIGIIRRKAAPAAIIKSVDAGMATLPAEIKTKFLAAVDSVQSKVPAAKALVDSVQAQNPSLVTLAPS